MTVRVARYAGECCHVPRAPAARAASGSTVSASAAPSRAREANRLISVRQRPQQRGESRRNVAISASGVVTPEAPARRTSASEMARQMQAYISAS
jgi:hypothetical protein